MIYLNPIDIKIFNFILNEINLTFPFKKKSKYDNKYYLELIIYILKSGCSLREANNTSIHLSIRNLIYGSIMKYLNDLFTEFIISYKRKIHNKLHKNIHKSSILTLFIDSSNIRNKNGTQLIVKINLRTVKVTIRCDQNKVPLIIATNIANIHDSKILSTSKLIKDTS